MDEKASLPARLAWAALEDWAYGKQETSRVEQLVKSTGSSGSAEEQAALDALTSQRAGVFVSYKKLGELRGCIGTIQATTASIFTEICTYAVVAASEDPRFNPIRPQELPNITCSVDVLGAAEPVQDVSALDAERYGVIVSSGYRRGLLLPNLEGVDTPGQQIDIALRKAGIRPDEPYSLERFEVVRYK
ncbi:MAG: AmmeMemoRadiSam system protein A [Coriobacteriales bacterium]|jgi:AmmeMemoRadiSam system protein A|nr:AmmeMemoRadiSam system protein A [Coriobacteriales bacterium]